MTTGGRSLALRPLDLVSRLRFGLATLCAGLGRRGLPRRGGAEYLRLARPASTGEVSAVVAACHAAGVPVVAQGGNTGLCGVLEWGMEAGLVLDGAIAASEAQRAAFWKLREEQPEGQRLEGPQLKHDIAVPPGRIADFVAEGGAVAEALLPGVRINPFGHLADGNIHYNLTPPVGAVDFAGLGPEIGVALGRLAQGMAGSFAAEHGLGRAKVLLADALRPEAERRAMRALKNALDSFGILNPGAVLALEPPTSA